MQIRNYLGLLFCLIIISCQSKDQKKQETFLGDVKPLSIQIYKMEAKDGAYEKGKLNFSEEYRYSDDGKKVEHYILNEDGNIKAKEIYVYQKEKLVGSNYLSPTDSLLSYYAVLVDSVGNVTSKKSFDGQNNELLRIETYEYDDQKLMKTKNIYDALGNPQRTFRFEHDEYGNEVSYKVFQPNGILIFNEEFKITKKDDQGRWLEKTGFRDDQPLTLNIRTLRN